MKSIFRILILVLIFLTGVGILAFYWTFYKPLPDYSATVELPGLEEPADIHWDPFGVPHIYADNKHDLYYAVGYVHAQDRLWQMTLSQIAAEGRFAEFLGEELIGLDKYQRTLGFWETARKIERDAPSELQQMLQAYSKGVNDYVERNRQNLPIEFALLGIKPIPWTPTHSYALSRLMAWDLNISWPSELTYAYLANRLPQSALQELFPVYDDSDPTMMDDQLSGQLVGALLPMIDTELKRRKLTQSGATAAGSNAWAVDGSRTESGLPLLAGDPHLGLSIPGYWYEVHLSTGGNNLSGATIPGAPMVVLGQNEELAWSMTHMRADDTDFFVELADPKDPGRYVADSLGGSPLYEPFDWREEILKVRNSDDRLQRIRRTRHGPVITDVMVNEELAGDQMVSVKWTGHEVSQELWALYQLNWSENIDGFQQALEHFKVPGQNFAYADRSGNIAIFSAAGLPVRDHNPILFRKGWEPSYDWQGWIPFDQLPRIVNPESGFVANANNKLHTESYPHYIATFWASPFRITRIEEYFEEFELLDVDVFQQMQFDSYSVHARELVELVLPVLRLAGEPYDFSTVTPYLANWNFEYEPSSTAATILDTFFMKLTRNTLLDELGETAYRHFVQMEFLPVQVMNRLLQENSFLFNNTETDVTETRNDIIHQSMQDAIDWLSETYGEEPIQWRWGNLHTITFKPPLFADARDASDAPGALRLIVDNLMSKGPYPAAGHGMSLNKGEYNWNDPFEMIHGASIRRIVDLSNPGRSYSVLPTGQSGNPLSDFYGDQTDLWLNGQYRYMYQDSTFFREISYQTMRLVPGER